MFNPHATFHLNWFGNKKTWKATNTAWEKWKPCKPTSPYKLFTVGAGVCFWLAWARLTR
jgi:hypothetical protein